MKGHHVRYESLAMLYLTYPMGSFILALTFLVEVRGGKDGFGHVSAPWRE